MTVRFRAIEREDLKQLRDWRNELKGNFREYRMLSMANQEAWFESLLTDKKTLMYAIEAPALGGGQELVGVCGWTYIDWLNRHAELSIYIGGQKGKGVGTTALEELHRIAFEELNLHTVRLEVYDFNPAKTLYPKLGYKIVGIWRECHFYKGRYWDSILMDMTREDWLRHIAGVSGDVL